MQENKQEKSQIKQNILLYLSKKGVTPYEFYKKSGVTRGVLGQNNGISEDNLTRFLAYAPDVNIVWLLTGMGEMILHTSATVPYKDKQNISNMQEKNERNKETDTQKSCNPTNTTSKPPFVSASMDTKIFLAYMNEREKEKDAIIEQKNQEINQLQREIGRLEGELKRISASNTSTSTDATIANAV